MNYDLGRDAKHLKSETRLAISPCIKRRYCNEFFTRVAAQDTHTSGLTDGRWIVTHVDGSPNDDFAME